MSAPVAGTAAARSTDHRSVVPAAERGPWRSVAMPTEHGGWGLTLEPVALGLAVAWSGAGLAIGIATFLAFLARTPLKLVLVDRHRDRSLPRTRRALIVLAVEATAMVVLAGVALARSGAVWLIPVAVAAPLVLVELAFDARSRSRRLLPELCGAAGIAASAAAISLAGQPLSVPGPAFCRGEASSRVQPRQFAQRGQGDLFDPGPSVAQARQRAFE